MIIPSTFWTMDQRGAKRVKMTGLKDKRHITAALCGTIQGDFQFKLFMKLQNKVFILVSSFHLAGTYGTHSKCQWSTEQTMIEYIHNVIILYISD